MGRRKEVYQERNMDFTLTEAIASSTFKKKKAYNLGLNGKTEGKRRKKQISKGKNKKKFRKIKISKKILRKINKMFGKYN